jgi:hypothetical protein
MLRPASAARARTLSFCGSWVKDYRAIPVDVPRDFARTQTEITSIRQVADDVGVGRSTLHKFILGRTAPQPRVRRLLAVLS